jgi:hypothetical protein
MGCERWRLPLRETDPGHCYILQCLDGNGIITITFVKREGSKYPGNKGHHPGTNLQEVLRACLARLAYLDGQVQDDRNKIAAGHLGRAIYLLEERAADRHHRKPPTPFEAIFSTTCEHCGHVGCQGTCIEGV